MSTTCTECSAAAASYKCPKCFARYCSVACCKSHKAKECVLPSHKVSTLASDLTQCATDSRQPAQWEGPEETEDRVPLDKLSKLGESESLRAVLHNPHLRAIMENLVNSDDPVGDMEVAMQEPIFVEFADKCLKVVEGDRDLGDQMST